MWPPQVAPAWSLCVWLLFALTASVNCRRLTAASKHPALLPRDATFEATHFGQTLVYADVDGDFGSDESVFSAQITMDTTLPAVVLDDYIGRFRSISCTTRTVTISFNDPVDVISAEEAWGVRDFLIITSVPGCADAGHHQPYRTSLAIYDYSTMTATLWAKRVNMKDCTHEVHIEVGHHMSGHTRPLLDRRFAEPQGSNTEPSAVTTSSITTTVTQSLAGPPSMYFNFSSVSATATTTALEASETIDFSYINKALIPPDFAAEQYLPSYPSLNHVNLTCANCTAVGQVNLVAGGFSVDMSEIEEVHDFFKDGYLEFSVDGLAAYMAFELSFLPGFTVHSFNAGLPPISVPFLNIAGILTIGPQIRPSAPISVELDSPVDLFFGLELNVPDNSSIILNLSDIGSSSSSGFEQTTISMLPFNYTAQNLSLTLSAGFKPAIVLSASADFLDVEVSGGVGAYLDLPMLTAQINHLSNMTASCLAPQPGSHDTLYGSLINIVPSYELGGGVQWDLGATIPTYAKIALGGAKDLYNYTKTLPTACLAFDKLGTLVNSTSTAAATVKSGAARGLDPRMICVGALLVSMAVVIVVG